MRKVGDLTIEELKKIIGEIIEKKLKDYTEEWEATIELMDKTILKDYLEAKEEISRGETVSWKEIKRDV